MKTVVIGLESNPVENRMNMNRNDPSTMPLHAHTRVDTLTHDMVDMPPDFQNNLILVFVLSVFGI